MNLFLTTLILLGTSLGCGETSQKDDTPQGIPEGFDAPPALIVHSEANSVQVVPSFDDSEDIPSLFTQGEVQEVTDDPAIDSNESFIFEPSGSSCYRTQHQSCQPQWRKRGASALYRFWGRLIYAKKVYYRYVRHSYQRDYQDPYTKSQPYPPKQNQTSYERLFQIGQSYSLIQAPKALTELSRMGQALFFDRSLSLNGQVACASCHSPNRGFGDGLELAQGISRTNRHSPHLINTSANKEYFWDGRAPSTKEQAKGPIESPIEHGISRGHVAKVIVTKYRSAYEAMFGPIPETIDQFVTEHARDPGALPAPSSAPSASEEILRLLEESNPFLLAKLSRSGQNPLEVIEQSLRPQALNPAWVSRYEGLDPQTKAHLDELFERVAEAIAAYEDTLLSAPSPFDQAMQTKSFQRGFTEREMKGFEVFLGKGQCVRCHNGPHFQDGDYHNIGAPNPRGIMDWGRFQVSKKPTDLGAFKTPSLRGLPQTAPYMHNGSIDSLSGVIEFYSRLDTPVEIGNRSPLLEPARLSPEEKGYLLDFLRSLNSPVMPPR